MSKKIAVIICAAGSSSRFGSKKKKQFTDLAGRAVFLRSIEFFSNRDDVKQIILCISQQDKEHIDISHGANLSFHGVKICIGGAERFETVAKALDTVKDDIDLVAVHDAVRCCLTEDWINKVFDKAAQTGSAILAARTTDTIKRTENGKITETIDRSSLFQAQTPQVFDKKLLKQAYENLPNIKDCSISDDSQLVEALGRKVDIVETDNTNIKITKQSDIAVAEAIIKSRAKSKPTEYIGPYDEAVW